jgi:hypothetical protein
MSGADSGVHRAFSDDEVHDILSEELERVYGDATFTIAEFAADTVTIFEVSRDEHGTPVIMQWQYAYVDGVLQTETADRWSAAMADPERFYWHLAPKLIVRTPHQLPGGLRDLLSRARDVPVYRCQAPLRELLHAVRKDSPLVLDYELAVLTRVPAGRDGAARLALTGQPLFSRGETRGCQVKIRVACEPTDAEGTFFAIVTREPRPELPPQARRMRSLQIQAAAVSPGVYDLTAVLVRPGLVRFEGLPVPFESSGVTLANLERLVPGELAARSSVHLMCLIEVCGADDGADDRLQRRIHWLEELINVAQADAGALRVSVVAYGAHGVAWKVDDRAPEVRAWTATGAEAITALRGLVGHQADEREYPAAAQLECALKLVRQHLAMRDGRPVIVTAGGRPPHPPGLDTSRQIIPCPDWVDGALELRRLLSLPWGAQITFGALRDPKCRGGVWEQLGEHAVATIDDAVDMEGFAAALGLRAAAQIVPFPVID